MDKGVCCRLRRQQAAGESPKGAAAGALCAAAWDRHDQQRVCTVGGSTLQVPPLQLSNHLHPLALMQVAGSARPDVQDVHGATADEVSLTQVWDLRTLSEAARVDKAHAGGARDVDCAPRQQHLVLTCGDDAKLRLWDLRCAPRVLPMAPLAVWCGSTSVRLLHACAFRAEGCERVCSGPDCAQGV